MKWSASSNRVCRPPAGRAGQAGGEVIESPVLKAGYNRAGLLLLLVVVLICVLIVAASLGAVSISIKVVTKMLLSRIPIVSSLVGSRDWSLTLETIFFKIRLPRLILAALVGTSLAVAGVIFQALFKNPMADPCIIGVSSGAALGATLAIIFKIGFGLIGLSTVPITAFLGALITVIIVYQIAKVGPVVPVTALLLSGIAVGSFISAITSLLMVLGGEDLHSIVFWLMGGLGARNWSHVKMILPFILPGLLFIPLFARDLNLILLGEEKAQQLGIGVEGFKKGMLALGSLITAAAVSVSGLIGFIGLMVPHIVRLITGPDHRILLPCSALVGSIFLIIADTLARLLLAPMEIPVGIVTALFGAPFFIFLLRKGKSLV